MSARHLDNVIHISRVPGLLKGVSRTSQMRLLHAYAVESTSNVNKTSHTRREYKIPIFHPYVLDDTRHGDVDLC
jgi:hypothetical protein